MTARPGSPRRAFDERIALLLMFTDLADCAAAVLAAYGLRAVVPVGVLSEFRHGLGMYLQALPVVAGLWLIAFYRLGLYEPRRFTSSLAELARTAQAVTLTALLVAAASFLSHRDYSRATLLLFWLSALGLALATRAAVRDYAHLLQRRGEATARALIVGCGDLARLVADRITSQDLRGYDLVGLVAVSGEPAVEGYPVLGTVSDLAELVRRHRVDEVLVAHPALDPGTLMTAVQACEAEGVEFHIVAGPLQVLTEQAELSGLTDLPIIELPPARFLPWQRAVKRGLDVLFSTIFLVLLAPVLLILGVLVWRDTGGSPVFRQTRVGYGRVPFTMLKFRTMRPTADPYADAPRDGTDARVTRLGRVLRRTSLDELPQLWNVLVGDMSLIGPRPEMPYIVDQYEPWQLRRLDVKPGITGLWQVLGRKDLPLRDNIEYDFYYIRNWSIWLDLTILLKTIPVVIRAKGAY
jgi:exopolysaccharide biosynthesis polyprenyl glycosylphosphotransferase